MPGAGSIYRLATGEFVGTIHDGDAAGLAAAKAALASGGLLQMGPGTEGITLGAGWGIISLARIDALGRMFLSRFNMTDGDDPTKALSWLCSGISPGTTRVVTVPNWSGILLLPATSGNSGEFLQSIGGGGAPIWAAVPSPTNALLDGVNHTDTVAQAVLRGALIVGNATPAWSRLAIGAANTVLTSDGTDVSWSINPAVQHDTLAHLKPVAVASCSWTTGTDIITSVNLPGAVKVGDYVYLGTNSGTQNQGRKVTVLGAGQVTVDGLNGNSTITNQTFVFQPGDHFNDTVGIHTGTGAGLLMTLGRGTYSTAVPSGTFQELHGPIRWGTFNNTILTDFRVAGYSGGTAAGFGIYDASNLTRVAYWNVGSLTGPANFTLPPTGGNVMTDASTNNAIAGTKHFTGPTILDSDGTAARTVFQTAGGANFLGFAPSGTTLRVATWPDWAGTVALASNVGSAGQVLTSNGAATAPSYQAAGGGSAEITKAAAATVAAGADITWLVLAANSADITVTTQTVVMTITTVGAGRYHFKCQLIWQAGSTTAGVDVSVNHTGTLTQFVAEHRFASTGQGAATAAASEAETFGTGSLYEAQGTRTKGGLIGAGSVSVDALDSDMISTIEGFFVVSVSGDLQILMGCEIASQTVRAMQGSFLELKKLS